MFFLYICRKGHGSAVFVPRVDELGDTDDIAAAGKYREAQDGNCGIIVAVIKIAEKVVVKVFIGVNIIAVDNASGKKHVSAMDFEGVFFVLAKILSGHKPDYQNRGG